MQYATPMRQRWGLFEGPFTEDRMRSIEDAAERLMVMKNADPSAFIGLIRAVQDRVPATAKESTELAAQLIVADEAAVPVRRLPVLDPEESATIRHPMSVYQDDEISSRMFFNVMSLGEAAQVCADRLGDREPSMVLGPFGALDIADGDTVVIRKGAPFRSMRQHLDDIMRMRCDTEIVIHRIHPGYIDTYSDSSRPQIVQPDVTWDGPDGYWRMTTIDFVEVTTAPAPAPDAGSAYAEVPSPQA